MERLSIRAVCWFSANNACGPGHGGLSLAFLVRRASSASMRELAGILDSVADADDSRNHVTIVGLRSTNLCDLDVPAFGYGQISSQLS